MSAIRTSENDIKERLSIAFVTAVAARAGCEVSEPKVDRMSVDVTISPISGGKVSVDLQLKATTTMTKSADPISFALPRKNYDHLRSTEVGAAQLLVVLDLPEQSDGWLEVSAESLMMRRCAYWLDLYGMPERDNVSSVTVYLPREQVFDTPTLEGLMERRFNRLEAGKRGIRMISDTIDSQSLRALSPHAVAAYLKSKGWSDKGVWGAHARLYARDSDGEKSEVVVPTKETLVDFERRMAELVHDLAAATHERPGRILSDLTIAPYDVVRVRAREADEYGSVELDHGKDLFTASLDMMSAAAIVAASPKPRPVIRGRNPREAGEYMNRVRLGQTERGSFVLTFLSPFNFSPPEQPALFGNEEPFGRRVTLGLSRALEAIDTALQQSVGSDDLRAFLEGVPRGVNARLCRALSRIAEAGGGADIRIGWSPQRPLVERASLSLQEAHSPVLTEAAKRLESQGEPVEEEFQGTVLGISENKDAFDGKVTLHLHYDGRPISVRASFLEGDRDRVFDAFHGKTNLQMTVRGKISREGNRFVLLDPHDFDVVEISEE